MTTEYDHTKKWYVILNGRPYYSTSAFEALKFATFWKGATPKPI